MTNLEQYLETDAYDDSGGKWLGMGSGQAPLLTSKRQTEMAEHLDMMIGRAEQAMKVLWELEHYGNPSEVSNYVKKIVKVLCNYYLKKDLSPAERVGHLASGACCALIVNIEALELETGEVIAWGCVDGPDSEHAEHHLDTSILEAFGVKWVKDDKAVVTFLTETTGGLGQQYLAAQTPTVVAMSISLFKRLINQVSNFKSTVEALNQKRDLWHGYYNDIARAKELLVHLKKTEKTWAKAALRDEGDWEIAADSIMFTAEHDALGNMDQYVDGNDDMIKRVVGSGFF